MNGKKEIFMCSYLFKVLFFIIGIAIFNNGGATTTDKSLSLTGKAIRDKLSEVYKEKKAKGTQRIIEITDICKDFPLVGRTIDEVNEIFLSAGQKFEVQPVKDPGAPLGQVFGGIVLEKSDFYSAVFNVTMHVSSDGTSEKNVDEIVYCNILVKSL
jgi:hypothetical protein